MVAQDYWKVNSYGYPNPFGDEKAVQAYETLSSFFDFSSYSKLKAFWGSTAAPRLLAPHAVESWKATFEEFGLLYVLTGDDTIHITPAGEQFKDAGDKKLSKELSWIGLSLLLRYPLRGIRRPKGPKHATSDLLLYWFLFAAMRELGNQFWWTELEHVLSQVFKVAEGPSALEHVRDLRAGRKTISSFPLPVANRKGGFYNSLNQVVVHASMGYLLLGKSTDDSLYLAGDTERRHWILNEAVALVDLALGGSKAATECDGGSGGSHFIARMPAAPTFGDEQSYFDYLGALVPPIPKPSASTPLPEISFEGGVVPVLRHNEEYELVESLVIRGDLSQLCKLARGQRLILTHDLARSFILEDKKRESESKLLLEVRKARPITNPQPVFELLEQEND